MRLKFSDAIRVSGLFAMLALVATNGHVRAALGIQSGITLANLDRTCKPCADFYQFADGGWIKNNAIPASQSSWGNFSVLAARNRDVLHRILNSAETAKSPAGSNRQKIGDFYAACMNTAAIDADGTKPIDGLLALANSATPQDLAATLTTLHGSGVDGFFNLGPGADFHQAALNIAQLRPAGLGLPDRDYYFSTDARTVQIRAAYLAHITAMFQLLGDSAASSATEAQAVMALETQLAQNTLSRVQTRDPASTYHKMTLADVQALAPALDLPAVFSQSGVPATIAVNVTQPDYFKALSAILAAAKPSDLQAYLRWHAVHTYATALSAAFAAENFNFYSKTMQGVQSQSPRWQQCTGAADRTLGEALGQFYVAQTFTAADKARALAMVKNIKQTLRDDFSTLSWMSQPTRQRAVAKLDAFLLKIGYPDKWRSYAGLPITRSSYALNLVHAAQFNSRDALSQIGRPVDRARWGMTPPTVNAYYNPTVNEIVFPAGILQPPFYNPNADMAVNTAASARLSDTNQRTVSTTKGVSLGRLANLPTGGRRKTLRRLTRGRNVSSISGTSSLPRPESWKTARWCKVRRLPIWAD
jgi:putative endopeptidase